MNYPTALCFAIPTIALYIVLPVVLLHKPAGPELRSFLAFSVLLALALPLLFIGQ